MSKTLEDILGTTDTAVPEIPETPVEETAADEVVSAEPEVVATKVVESADEAPDAAEVVASAEDATATVEEVETDYVEPENDAAQQKDEEFHPYLKSIIRPVVLYGNKYCTKPQGRFSGTVKVIAPPENGVALVEYMIITNGARRKMKAYIHI